MDPRVSVRRHRWIAGVALALITSTMAPGPGSPWATPVARATAPSSTLAYQSEVGSPVGRGWTFFTTSTESTFEGTQVRAADRTVSIGVGGPGDGRLVAGRTYDQGSVTIWDRYPVAGVCDPSRKAFTVLAVGYDEGGTMTHLALSIRWSCVDASGNPTATFFAELRLNTSDPPYGGVVLSPDGPIGAGRVALGASRDVTVRATGVGTRATSVGQIGVTGDAASDYSIRKDGCSGQALEVGAACTFDVRLAPTSLGDRPGRLVVPLDTAAGSRTVPVSGFGQTATTVSLSVPPGPFNGSVPVTVGLEPRPDDGFPGYCANVRLRNGAEDINVDLACGTIQLKLDPGAWTAVAEFSGTDRYAGSRSETVPILVVEMIKDWGEASIDLATFYPYPDGYLDLLPMRIQRNHPIATSVAVRSVASGAVVDTMTLPTATGTSRIGWDGRRPDGTGLLPAGLYDVAITLSDDVGNARTITRRIRLAREWADWTVRTVTRAGERYALVGRSKDASVSTARSTYPAGVRLTSGTGAAAVVYAFPVVPSTVYGAMTLEVRGRSLNGHQAAMAAWNPRLGTYLDLTSYDGARIIGPAERGWSITVLGMDHIKNGAARLSVMTWAGLGRSGSAVFDIEQVRLRYRTGVLRSAATAPALPGSVPAIPVDGPRIRPPRIHLVDDPLAGSDGPVDPAPTPDATSAPTMTPAPGSTPEPSPSLVPSPSPAPPPMASPGRI